jgi:pilus assembly protein CpaF
MPDTLPSWSDDELLRQLCQRLVDEPGEPADTAETHARQLSPLLDTTRRQVLVQRALAEISGLGSLQGLLDDPEVDEVMVNAGREVWIERRGRLVRAGHIPPGRLDAVVERILAPLGRRLDRASPVVDARLPDGSRVCAVAPPIAVDGPCLCIRRFRVSAVPLNAFGPSPVVELLTQVVHARCNVVVAGATSAGKTTLLNAMAGVVAVGERLVTLEDTAELRLPGEHVVRLEARPATADGPPPVELQQLLRAALRLRPDRLVIGEVRGPEALDLLQAMNTGHDGSMATVHANSPDDTVRRLAAMVLQAGHLPAAVVGDLVRSSIDIVVQVARGPGGERQVVQIAELSPPDHDGPPTRLLAQGGQVVAQLSRARSR